MAGWTFWFSNIYDLVVAANLTITHAGIPWTNAHVMGSNQQQFLQ